LFLKGSKLGQVAADHEIDDTRKGQAYRYVARRIVEIRWDEKAGLRRDAVGSQVIDVLEAQEIKETGNEED
jgi:hypothetical protein